MKPCLVQSSFRPPLACMEGPFEGEEQNASFSYGSSMTSFPWALAGPEGETDAFLQHFYAFYSSRPYAIHTAPFPMSSSIIDS